MQKILVAASVLCVVLLVLYYRKRLKRINNLIEYADKAKKWKDVDKEIEKVKAKIKKSYNPIILLPGIVIAYTACSKDIKENTDVFLVITSLWLIGSLCYEYLMELYERVSLEKASFICNEKYLYENKERFEMEDYVNGKHFLNKTEGNNGTASTR